MVVTISGMEGVRQAYDIVFRTVFKKAGVGTIYIINMYLHWNYDTFLHLYNFKFAIFVDVGH